jgi:lipase maturation factor 1
MSFQWDALLLEVGFLALFAVPWNFDFTLMTATAPHWLVRGMFYFVLFKLMFLSGVVKILSGDESWRDLTALSYHYWTQPLPNPVSPFMHALPVWVHQISTGITFVIELVVPFFMLWPRARIFVAAVIIALSLLIFTTGNYTFFNLLTMALCLWLVPDGIWERALPFTLQIIPAPMFPNPMTVVVIAALGLLSLFWCTRFWLPETMTDLMQPVIQVVQSFHISNPYGLFANMTKSRPEIVIEGSDDGTTWKEYQFRYKPGDVSRPPPIVAPHQPRLDWQMWFAALGTIRGNMWVQNLMLRIFENSPDVMEFFSEDPFTGKPPKYLRARLYEYEFTDPQEIINGGDWWKRKLTGEYTPVLQHQ